MTHPVKRPKSAATGKGPERLELEGAETLCNDEAAPPVVHASPTNVATGSVPYTTAELQQMGLDPQRLPQHVAIIMDGNGRWAQARGKLRIEGHRQGVFSVRAVVEECARLNVSQLTLYCLSSENWKRPRLELDLLMSLLQRYVVAERAEIMRQNIRFCTIGREDKLSRKVLREVHQTIAMSAENTGMKLCLALDYGSRQEITDAVRKIAAKVQAGTLLPDEIDEQTVSDHLNTSGMIDPDLVIRTANERRISNFLLWQISYAELHICDTFWPDFREENLREALRDFASRERRFGGLNLPKK
ncbi:MAG: isoprenyl transferase [Planctomycetaceae bacterium]